MVCKARDTSAFTPSSRVPGRFLLQVIHWALQPSPTETPSEQKLALRNSFSMQSDDETPDIQNIQLVEAVRDNDLRRCQTLVQQWKRQRYPSAVPPQHLARALAAAVGSKHLRIVACLLEQGAVVSGNFMVMALDGTDDAIAIYQTFLDYGWDINSKTDLGNIMLKWV